MKPIEVRDIVHQEQNAQEYAKWVVPSMVSFTEKQLFEMSKRNGLVNYDWRDVVGWDKMCPNLDGRNVIFPNGGVPLINQQLYAVGQVSGKALKKVNGCGTICLLEWGENIPLKNSVLAPNVAGLQSTVTWNIDCSSDDAANQFGQLYIINMYEQEVILGQDGNALPNTELLNIGDVSKALQVFNARVSRGVYENVYNIRGGNGFFRKSVAKLKHYLPKVMPVVRAGINAYHTGRVQSKKLIDMLSK